MALRRGKKKDETSEEQAEPVNTTNEQESNMTEVHTDPDEATDVEAFEVEEDDFSETVWPADTWISVYVKDPMVATSTNSDSKIFGKQFISGELVAQDSQASEELEHLAGTSLRLFLVKGADRDKRNLYAFLTAIFGEIPKRFTHADIANQPLAVKVRVGKTKTDPDTGYRETPMYIDKIRPDRSSM